MRLTRLHITCLLLSVLLTTLALAEMLLVAFAGIAHITLTVPVIGGEVSVAHSAVGGIVYAVKKAADNGIGGNGGSTD